MLTEAQTAMSPEGHQSHVLKRGGGGGNKRQDSHQHPRNTIPRPRITGKKLIFTNGQAKKPPNSTVHKGNGPSCSSDKGVVLGGGGGGLQYCPQSDVVVDMWWGSDGRKCSGNCYEAGQREGRKSFFLGGGFRLR